MKIPNSLRRLVRDLNSASPFKPSWLWLNGNPVDQTLWKMELPSLVPPADGVRLPLLVEHIRAGAHIFSSRSPWFHEFVNALLGPSAKPNEHLMVPFHCGATLVACMDWEHGIDSALDVTQCIPDIRNAFRNAWELEMTRSECHALRWVLDRSDRLTAVVRPDGKIVAASPMATDLMNSFHFGSRHYFHEGVTELPGRLVESMRATCSGQIRLTETCTARFDRLAPAFSWLPLIVIEFFVESRRTPPPISRLTPVERQVYELLQTGASNREIAFQRGTSFATAKNQVSAILSKLGVSRRHHLMINGAGLISPPAQLNRPGMNGVTISTR